MFLRTASMKARTRSDVRHAWERRLNQVADYGWLIFPAVIMLKLTPAMILGGLLMVHYLIFRPRYRPIIPSGLGWPLICFYCWVLVSALVARPELPYVKDAFSKWIYILFLIPAFGWASASKDAGRQIRISLVILVALTAVLIPYMVKEVLALEGGRAGGLMGGPPNVGTKAMILAILFAAYAFHRQVRPSLLTYAGLVVMLVTLGLSFNRASLVGAAFGLGLICVRRSPVLIAVVLALLIGFSTLAPRSFLVVRLRCALVPSDPASKSALERIYLWGSGIKMIRDRPLAGLAGRRNYREWYERVYRDPRSIVPKAETPGHVHNSILQAAVLHGVPGLGLMLWWITVLFRKALRLWQGAERIRDPDLAPLAFAFLPMLTAVCVNSLFDFVVAESQRAMMFYTFTGLILGALSTSTIKHAKRRP
jgi:O-antigen ligase